MPHDAHDHTSTVEYQIACSLYSFICLFAVLPSVRSSNASVAWKAYALIYAIGNFMCLGVDKFPIVKNAPERLSNIPVFVLGIFFALLTSSRFVLMRVLLLKKETFDFSSLYSPFWLIVNSIPFALFFVNGKTPMLYVIFFLSSVILPLFSIYGWIIKSAYISKFTMLFVVLYSVGIIGGIYMKFGLQMHKEVIYCEYLNVLANFCLLLGIREMDQKDGNVNKDEGKDK